MKQRPRKPEAIIFAKQRQHSPRFFVGNGRANLLECGLVFGNSRWQSPLLCRERAKRSKGENFRTHNVQSKWRAACGTSKRLQGAV